MSEESGIQPFRFEEWEIRFIGTSEVPEWVGSDIVAVLYPEAARTSYNKYLDGVPSEWKDKKRILTPGGHQEVTTLFEPGFYALVARSNSPVAVRFQKWVYEEVLPFDRVSAWLPNSGVGNCSNRTAVVDRPISFFNAAIEPRN